MSFESGIIPEELQGTYFDAPSLDMPQQETSLLDLLGNGNAQPTGYQPPATDPVKSSLESFAAGKASQTAEAAPVFFDWNRSQADRYVNSDHYKTLGFNPNIGRENEYKYGRAQTWGDVWSNGLTGMFKLAGNTYIEGWKGWGDIGSAIYSTNWNEAKQDLMGTPEELMASDKETKDIMNKYAIFETPDSEKGVFNRSMFGTMLQQSGFAVGTIGQFLSEELLTYGLSTQFSLAKLGMKEASWMGKIVKAEEVAKDLKRLGDPIWKSRSLAEGLVQGARKFVPMFDAAHSMVTYGKAGAGALQIAAIGVGGLRRLLSETNMAMTEARMEMAGTYGDLYTKLYDEELFETGQGPDFLSTERMKKTSMDAAHDNFAVNTGILMLANRLQFDNLFSKFKFGRSVLGEAGGFAEDVISVTGRKAGKEAGEKLTKQYAKGAFGTFSTIGKIAADFGGGKAAWEATKAVGRNVFKWEASEGLQELFQEGSNTTLQDYYYDLYHGYKGGFEKSIKKGIESQENVQGLKTFLMGALTGRLLSPMNYAVGKAKLYAGTTSKERTERKTSIADSIKLVNAFYENPNKFLPEHIANVKVQNKVAKNMEEAIANRDEYVFHNNKDSGFAKMISAAIKTGTVESVIDTLKAYGETFDDKSNNDFKEAFGMTPDETNRGSVKEFFNKIADDVVEYHKNWKALTDKYGDLVKVDLYREGSESHKVALMAKRVLNDAIEMMATTDYKAKQSTVRAVGLQTKMAAEPVIGGSTASAFRNLGVMENTDLEIDTLEEEIKSAEAVPKKDKATKDLIKSKKNQLKALQSWKENHPSLRLMGRKQKRKFNKALKAFESYMNSKNQEAKIDITIKGDQLQDIYEKLIDYIDLNTDNKEYIDAYNILANPIQFVNVHRRLMDAMEATGRKLLAEHIQEIVRQAQGKPPVKEEDEPELAHTVVPQADGKFSVVSPKGTVVAKDIETLEAATAQAKELDEALKKKNEKKEGTDDTPDTLAGLDENSKVSASSNGIFLIEKNDPETGTFVYYIVNKDGGFVTEVTLDTENYPEYQNAVLYENYESAKRIFDALVEKAKKDNGEYTFDGKKIKQGTILLDSKGRRHKVITKTEPETENGIPKITIVNITNGSTATSSPLYNLKGWRLESEVEQASEPQDPNAFKLLRNNELLKIYAHVNREAGERRAEAEVRLAALLLNTPSAQLAAGLSISVTKNAIVTPPRFAADAEGNNENKRLRINGEPYAIALIFNGQPIGYLPYFNEYSYIDNTGAATDMGMITIDRFKEIFDPKGKDVSKEYKWFKDNYAKSRKIHGILINELKGGDSVVLSPDVINSLLTVTTSTGDYSYVDKNGPIPTLNDLKYKTVGGFTYIIDRRTKHLGDMMFQSDEVIRTNAPMAQKEAIDKRVKEARFNSAGEDVLKNQGRYVAAVELPNGKIRFVELSTFEIPTADLNELVTTFNERSKKLKEENLQEGIDAKTKKPFTEAKDVTASNDINENISDTIYITVPGRRGMTVNLMLTPMGNVKVEFAVFFYGKKTPDKGSIILKESDTDDTKPLALKDINDLIDRINRAVAQYDAKGETALTVDGRLKQISTKDNPLRLTVKNFKRSISESFSPDEYNTLQTNTTVDVVKNTNISLVAKEKDGGPGSGTTTGAPKNGKLPSTEDIDIPEDIAKAQAEAIRKRKAEQDRLKKEKEERDGKRNIADIRQDLETKRYELADIVEGELIAQGMPKAERRTYLGSEKFSNDPRVRAIDQQLAIIDGSAGKKVSDNLSEEDILDIAEFRKWMKEHLPEYISDEDLKLISSKMKGQGVTVGMFYMHMDRLNQKLTGRLALSKYAPAYHEAFHAIFRMMLSDDKIEQLYKIARKELLQQGKSIAALKKELLENAPEIYSRLSEKELEERVYEEYMADKFQDWKKDVKTNTSPTNKSFFRKLLDFILNFFKSLKKSPLENLFMKIEKGAFKNSQVVANRFTEGMQIGITEPALKAIQIGTTVIDNEDGERERIPIYLSQQEGELLSSTIAAVYHKKMSEAGLRSHSEAVLDQILDDYANLYDIRINPYYQSDDFHDNYPTASSELKAIEKLKLKQRLFTQEDFRKTIKDSVKIHTDIMGYREKDISDEDEADIDDFGDRATTDKRKESYSIGGYGSLSKELRQYLSTIVEEVSDEFGNKEFVTEDGVLTGVHLIEAANASVLYNGLLKAVSGSITQEEILEKFKIFSEHNPEANKFWNKFSKDVDLIYDEDDNFVDIGNKKQATLFQAVIKGFMQHSVDYYFNNMDIGKGKSIVMEANRRGAAKNQFSIWYNAYLELFSGQYQEIKRDRDSMLEFMDKKTRGLSGLMNLLNKGTYYNDDILKSEIEQIITTLKDDLGISLSPLYVKYSYLKSIVLDAENPADIKNFKLIRAFEEVEPMTEESIREIYSVIRAGKNPFGNNVDPDKLIDADAQTKLLDGDAEALPGDDNEKDEDVEDDIMGAIGRLTIIAAGNAVFDEQVATTSFKNASGELVHSHQMPTFNLIRGKQIQDGDFRKELKKDPFLRTNFLLNNPLFEYIADSFKIARADGIKASSLSKKEGDKYVEDKKLNVNQNKGVTYGEMSDREFVLTLLNLYGKNTVHTVPKNGETKSQTFATSPVLMGVLEASNTGDIANLPIIKTVELVKGQLQLTSVAQTALYNEILREYDRISRTQDEIDNGFPRGVIDGYHNGDPAKGGERGLRFIKMRSMLGGMVDELETNARNGEEITTDQKSLIFKNINDYWVGPGGQLDGFIQDLTDLGLIYTDAEDNLRNRLLDKTIFYGHKIDDKADTERNQLTNLNTARPDYNLAQVLINNYINALSVNQLFANDVAENFKDDGGIDEVKRNKVRNGSGADISSIITAPQLGITHANRTSHVAIFDDPGYNGKFSGKVGQKADAQMFMSTKGLRYTLFGLGKLNAAQAELLDKIEQGKSVSVADIFGDVVTDVNGKKRRTGGSIQFNAQTQSIKLVYGDGQKIVKTSGIILTKEYTSMRDGRARPGMEDLHNLREKLEDFEGRNQTIAFGIPKSAAKGKKTNIADNVDAIDDKNFIEHDNRFWRLQLENPSNKLEITDPTQAKQSIISEQYRDLDVTFQGESMKLGKVIDQYLSDTEQRVKNNYFKSRDEIFDIKGAFRELGKSLKQGEIKPKLGKFLENACKTLASTGADPQIIEFFTPQKNEKTGELTPIYDLNHPMLLDKFTQLFLAYFSKGVMSEKVPGHSLTLVSNWGSQVVKRVIELDENGQPKRWEVITRKRYEKDAALLSEARRAKRWNNELDREFEDLMVGDLYIDDLRHNVPEYDKNGKIIGYFTEFMMPPHFKEHMVQYNADGTLSDDTLRAFGVRIPSQDKHSAVTLKLVDFLPAYYGSIGVFPHELIEISGADFDVDKLYMHIMDSYTKDNQRIAYGTAKTIEDKFVEYVHYLCKKDKVFKAKMKELENADIKYDEDADRYDDENENETYDNIEDLFHDLLSPDVSARNLLEIRALQELKLPSSPKEYAEYIEEYGEPNNGVLNNRILNAKIKLLNNEGMVTAKEGEIPVAFQVAEVQPLLDAVNTFIDKFKVLHNVLIETGVDMDSIRGMFRSFKNNKEGAKGIGPAVNSMLTAALMNAFYKQTKLRKVNSKGEAMYALTIDGHEFDTYEHSKAWNNETQTYDGKRVFYNISAIVSAMTDNAKERLAARLGLNINAIDVVSNMVALGVPLETALMFNLQPSVRKFYEKIAITNKNIKTKKEQEIYKSKVGEELLEELSKKRGEDTSTFPITTDLLEKNIKSQGGNANADYSVFSSFLEFYKQTQYFSAVSQVLKLSKGLGTSNESIDKIEAKEEMLGLNLSDEEFVKTNIPFDLRQVLTGTDEFQPHHRITANYLRIKNQIQDLQKSVMIEKSYMFKRLKETVLANLKVDNREKEKFNIQLKRDLISYLGMKAYIQYLKVNGKGTKLEGLTNALIYDASAVERGEGFKDIVDTIRAIREELKDSNDGKGNYFAKEFLNIIPVMMTDLAKDKQFVNPKNRGGINIVEINTWAKLGQLEINKLKDSFLEMYSNHKTRPMVYTLFNYLLVKDGGQYKSGSFIRYMPPAMFKELLDATKQAHSLLKEDSLIGDNASYKELFGATGLEIFNEFTRLYSTNINNGFSIKKVKSALEPKDLAKVAKPDTIKGYIPKIFLTDDKNIKIDMFGGIREKELQWVTDEDGRSFMTETMNTGKFSPDELDKMHYNQDLLRALGFSVINRPDKDGKNNYFIELPYTLKISTGDQINGYTENYYKLKSVSKEKDSKTSPGIGNFILEAGDNLALGSAAVYEKFDLVGSKNQWRLAELTGETPSNVVVRQRFGKNRNKFDLEGFSFEDQIADIEAMLAGNDILMDDHVQNLIKDYGIHTKFVGPVLSFYKIEKGKDVPYETTAKTPQELYEMKEKEYNQSGGTKTASTLVNPFAGMEDIDVSSAAEQNFGDIDVSGQPESVAEKLKKWKESIDAEKAKKDKGC